MGMLTSGAKLYLSSRNRKVDNFRKNPIDLQKKILKKLLLFSKKTSYGIRYSFNNLINYKDFSEAVPVVNYEEFYPEIKKVLSGEENVLWPEKIKWFAKSSGTTNDKSKFIPVSQMALNQGHYKAGIDMLSIYLSNYNSSNLFDGKSLALGGSKQINLIGNAERLFTGDISAVLLKNLPFWARLFRTPSLDVAMMPEWENKLKKIALITSKQNITNISGVPTWTIVLIKEILKITKSQNILEVWPNLELFIHGAVSFKPYKDLFKELIPSNKMRYLETYNASEGFFAVQDNPKKEEMLLFTDHGIFYEFENTETKEVVDLSNVNVGSNYALIITTNSGLWRYRIGDTIRFYSVNPYKIKISGRTKHFINAFGEELIIENADTAMELACKKHKAPFYNYTAGPVYISGNKKGRHEWFIEFLSPPKNLKDFAYSLDTELKNLNSDYEAKRYKDLALEIPLIKILHSGTFDKWLKKKNMLGGQNKIPRLSNNRKYLDDILKITSNV